MSWSNTLAVRLQAIETWIQNRPRPLLCCPLRLFAAAMLTAALPLANLIALVRWPLAAAARMWRGPSPAMRGTCVSADARTLVSLLRQPQPVIVEFGAEWCAPCLIMKAVLSEFAVANADRVIVAVVDSTTQGGLTKQHRVAGLPTLLLFRNGTERARHVGLMTRDALEAWVTDG